MLKITGGELRGRNLRTPPGLETRPTAAKVRQALFNILAERVAGAVVADLYAGGGTLGIEALSRGAASCLFVEQRRQALGALRENLASLGLGARARVVATDAGRAGGWLAGLAPLDLVLADPPYGQGQVARLAALLAAGGLLAPQGLMVIEHSPRERPPLLAGLALADRRAYGQTELSFLALAGGAPTPADPTA